MRWSGAPPKNRRSAPWRTASPGAAAATSVMDEWSFWSSGLPKISRAVRSFTAAARLAQWRSRSPSTGCARQARAPSSAARL